MSATASLIKKYNVPGPRYTSYPTAVQFDLLEPVSLGSYLQARNSSPRDISLYLHLPFCASLCWYCGCTTVITKKKSAADDYLDYLEKEMKYYAALLHPEHVVKQVHYGGGTPTFLTPEQLSRLGEMLHTYFNIAADAEFGVELDPRTFTREHLTAMMAYGMNRASIGFQDVNEEVQEAIHRIQPMEMVQKCMDILREAGISSINLDVIYGLPMQNRKRFARTLEAIKSLDPDRVAMYSYAHVPWIKPAQKLLEDKQLPDADLKLQLLLDGIAFMEQSGFEHIGMDHFAKPNDELSVALRDRSLQRNFQGYSTMNGLDLYALGMSSISSVGDFYFQNEKELDDWKAAIDSRGNAWVKGLRLTNEDRLRRSVIMQLMCSRSMTFSELQKTWQIDAKVHFRNEIRRLRPLEEDGIVSITEEGIQVHAKGRFFVRNIAMVFDAYMAQHKEKPVFSKTI
ncbi:MAG: oxygen-independent coproporphyrinogen III oxidase [Balneolales bacterium]|nr:oxygen-independent coproporphyrinogen III oxidase [Balneolales bacterium]